MKSYQIWLIGGGNIVGKMTDEDAAELKQAKQTQRGVIINFVDDDGDDTTIEVDQIAAFAFRDAEPEKGIGYT